MDSEPLFLDLDDLYLNEDYDAPPAQEGDSWLPSDDYNLNSPLLRDKVDLFVKKLNSKATCQERTALGQHISLSNLEGTLHYHRFAVCNFLQSKVPPPQNDAHKILQDVEKGISSASDIHSAFWRHFGKGLSLQTLDPKWLTDYYDQDFRFRKDLKGIGFFTG